MTIERRAFLRALGMGTLASGASSLIAANPALAQRPRPPVFVIREDRFGRMFPNLNPFADSSGRLLSALREMGKPGGVLDAADDLAAGPVALIADAGAQRQ